MSDGLPVPPSATAAAPMATSAALRQYSEMLSNIEGRVDEGVYLQVCNAGMDLHKAKAADLRARPRLGDECSSMPPSAGESEDGSEDGSGDELDEAGEMRRNLRTVRMVHTALRETLDENERLRAANNVHQVQLCSVLERVDALQHSVECERRRRTFHKKCRRALEGIVLQRGVASEVIDKAYAVHGVLDQVSARRERKRKRGHSEPESASDEEL